MTDFERFIAKVIKTPDGCWNWSASHYPNGYGQFWVKGKNVKAHRYAYQYFVGPIPDGLTIDHLCRNRGCVRPDHLEPVTNRENILRGMGTAAENARKTHCPQGHRYDAENTWVTKRGDRICRTCDRLKAKEKRKERM